MPSRRSPNCRAGLRCPDQMSSLYRRPTPPLSAFAPRIVRRMVLLGEAVCADHEADRAQSAVGSMVVWLIIGQLDDLDALNIFDDPFCWCTIIALGDTAPSA
jgi:hypothetical protein